MTRRMAPPLPAASLPSKARTMACSFMKALLSVSSARRAWARASRSWYSCPSSFWPRSSASSTVRRSRGATIGGAGAIVPPGDSSRWRMAWRIVLPNIRSRYSGSALGTTIQGATAVLVRSTAASATGIACLRCLTPAHSSRIWRLGYRVLASFFESLLLLVLREEQEKLQDQRALVGEHGLEADDALELALEGRITQAARRMLDERHRVPRAEDDPDLALGRQIAPVAPHARPRALVLASAGRRRWCADSAGSSHS